MTDACVVCKRGELEADIERLQALGSRLIDAMDDMHSRGETFTARVSVASAALRAALKDNTAS